jgi:hypothetical protein
VKILLAYGADRSIDNRDGVRSLQHAERKDFDKIAALLRRPCGECFTGVMVEAPGRSNPRRLGAMPENEDWPQGRPERTGTARDRRTGSAAAAARIQQQATWVDLQVQRAIKRGDFDHLPGAGKPIADLDREHDPDWWLKRLIARERITGVLPPSLQLRKDDAEFDALLDKAPSEGAARELVEDFNKRVIAARYSLPEGPPLITMPRDVDQTLGAWRLRRAAKRPVRAPEPPVPQGRSGWFSRLFGRR